MGQMIAYPWARLTPGEYFYHLPHWTTPLKVSIARSEDGLTIASSFHNPPKPLASIPMSAEFQPLPLN